MSEELTEEEIEFIADNLKHSAIEWLKTGEDVIISLHALSQTIGVVVLQDEEEVDGLLH